jgi:large subunit ribosomal protein L31
MVYEKQEKHHNFQNVNTLKKIRNMAKPEIHPEWFTDAVVYCDGKPLCTLGSTKKELQADIWLANHPFYSSSQTLIDSEGRVERFMKKYGLNSNV